MKRIAVAALSICHYRYKCRQNSSSARGALPFTSYSCVCLLNFIPHADQSTIFVYGTKMCFIIKVDMSPTKRYDTKKKVWNTNRR